MNFPPLQHLGDAKPTVLVVDDEAGPRDALKIILRPFFTVLTAENAQAALTRLSEEPIDLVTLDQKLPDRQGLDLLQDIKALYPAIEVVMITGHGSVHSALECLRHGAAGYLLKPFNVTELIALVGQTLGKKQRLDLIRTILQDPSSPLWGSEEQCTRAWGFLKTAYFAMVNQHQEAESDSLSTQHLLLLLSDMLEAKDRHLLSHSSRVSFYATLLANRLHLTQSELQSLSLGAFLHDFGTLRMASYRLADEWADPEREQSLVNEHADAGARMILPLGLPAEVGQIVAYHHEYWDGSRSPNGLRSEGIPLLARIVGLAEAFDRLTADVPGHQALPLEEALDTLMAQAGTRFDPLLASLFQHVATECRAALPATTATTASLLP